MFYYFLEVCQFDLSGRNMEQDKNRAAVDVVYKKFLPNGGGVRHVIFHGHTLYVKCKDGSKKVERFFFLKSSQKFSMQHKAEKKGSLKCMHHEFEEYDAKCLGEFISENHPCTQISLAEFAFSMKFNQSVAQKVTMTASS
jgi:hypothetical protein